MINRIYLEVYDHAEDDDGSHEVREIGKVLPVEGFPEGPDLILTSGKQMEESDDGTFELSSTAGIDGGGGERLPHDGLADVGGDEEGDARAKAVSLL